MKNSITFILLILSGCVYPSERPQERAEVIRQPADASHPAFKERVPERALLELAGPEEIKVVFGRRAITGTVINRSRSKLRLVQITYSLYDGAGNQIGTAYTNTSGLEPGASWKFIARAGVGDFADYKLSELKGDVPF